MSEKLKQQCFASDLMSITSRIVTEEGYLVVPGTLARTGIQEYRAYELGLDTDGVDPMKVIRLHRPAEEVFSPESIASFESKPVTVNHPSENVTAENWKEYAVGEVRDVSCSGELMSATVLIKDQGAIADVQSGKSELSNGYSFLLDLTPGTTNDGKAYDGIQRHIRGNHVALVDAARCGSACRIADSQHNPKGNTMADKRKVIVDGIALEVDDTAASAIDTLIKQRNAARDELEAEKLKVGDSVTVKLGDKQTVLNGEAVIAALAAKDGEIEQLKKDVMTPAQRDAMVGDWAKTIGDAKRLVPELVTDGKTCLAIRREVIASMVGKDETAKAVATAVLAGKELDTADADTVRATFQAIAASTKADDSAQKGADAALAAALAGEASGTQSAQPEVTGRDAFMARQASAWKPNQA